MPASSYFEMMPFALIEVAIHCSDSITAASIPSPYPSAIICVIAGIFEGASIVIPPSRRNPTSAAHLPGSYGWRKAAVLRPVLL